ncbi:MAG: monomethylamine:corrinoid methyltransferase, partial [Dehalococcoidia bacterium]
SIIKQPEVNGVCPGSMVKVGGFENKIGTAGELMNVFHEVRLVREAIQRAGRPGFVIGEAPAAAVSPFALIAAFSQGYYSRTDTHMPMHLYPGLKFDWERLILAAYARQMAIHPITCHMEVRGINVRDAWEAAIADVGGSMAYLSINGAHGTHGAGYSKGLEQDMRYNLQAKTLKNLALTRNGPVCCIGMSGSMGGECTRGAAYGNAYLSFGEAASGAALVVFSAFFDHDRTAGLAAKMVGEATIAAAGLERQEANKILNGIISLIDGLGVFDLGKTFPECYDVEKAEPTDENKRVYAEAKNDLREVGVPFKY